MIPGWVIAAAAVAIATGKASSRVELASVGGFNPKPPALKPTLLHAPERKWVSSGLAFAELDVATLRAPRLFKVFWRASAWQKQQAGDYATICASGRLDVAWDGKSLSAVEVAPEGLLPSEKCAPGGPQATAGAHAVDGVAVFELRLDVAGPWTWTLRTRTIGRVE